MFKAAPITLLISLFTGIVFALFYQLEISVPIQMPLAATVLSLIICFIFIYSCVGSFLVGIMMLFFAAPMFSLMPYFLMDDYNWGWTGNLKNAINHEMNVKIALILAVGSFGLLSGSLLKTSKILYKNKVLKSYKPLTNLSYNTFCLLAIFFSYLSAPTGTIFTGEYGGERLTSLALRINFPAAYVVSYSIFISLAVDQLNDLTQNSKKKIIHLTVAILYVVIFLQFSRGDREIFGLLVAFLVLFIVRPAIERAPKLNIKQVIKRRFLKSLLVAFLGLFLVLAIGILRFSIYHGVFNLSGIFNANPWIMSLTSFVAFFSSEMSEKLLYGKTYLDYLMSLPPGMLTKFLGIERSIESYNNIATKLVETGMTSGGAHVSLVGLSNFGIVGLFFVMVVYGFCAAVIERHAIKSRSLAMIIWLNLISVVPIWFWYGEMSVIRALMSAILIHGFFKLSIFKRNKRTVLKLG